MKIAKGLSIATITILTVSCFDPPEYPLTPEIEFKSVRFTPGGTNGTDTLSVTIQFKDGNGDLGLDASLLDHATAPYHPVNYFLANNGEIFPVETLDVVAATQTGGGDSLQILTISDPNLGKLATHRTQRDPQFSFLPPFTGVATDDCPNYVYSTVQELLVQDIHAAILDDEINVVDTVRLYTASSSLTFYQIQDTLYYQPNPNHYNIDIQFLVKDPLSQHPQHPGFTEYDFREEFCLTFNGRFPILSDTKNALEGELTYDMESAGFLLIFGTNTPLKLRIRIRDRARNVSNFVESQVFTLDQI